MNNNSRDGRHGTPLDAPTRRRLLALVSRVGERQALELLGIPRPLLARATGQLGIRRGNVLIIQAALDRLDAAGNAGE